MFKKKMAYGKILNDLILSLLRSEKVKEQAELSKLLEARGFRVPQATLSRRLKKMKIAKVDGVYQTTSITSSLNPNALSIHVTDSSFIFLRTLPGQANAITYIIDQDYTNIKNPTDILGTIAGDDSILIILNQKSNIDTCLSMLKERFLCYHDSPPIK